MTSFWLFLTLLSMKSRICYTKSDWIYSHKTLMGGKRDVRSENRQKHMEGFGSMESCNVCTFIDCVDYCIG